MIFPFSPSYLPAAGGEVWVYADEAGLSSGSGGVVLTGFTAYRGRRRPFASASDLLFSNLVVPSASSTFPFAEFSDLLFCSVVA